MQSVINNPLLLREKESPAGTSPIVESGSTVERRFVVFNLGKKNAEINISFTVADRKSEQLQQWVTLEPNSITLEAGDSKEISLSFEIPQQATPGNYRYEIFLEAPAQYPDKFFRSSQQIVVDRPQQENKWGEAAKFTLKPPASSNKPYRLKIEQKVEIKIEVENSSLLVDSFELSCPDLETKWYTIHYPERDIELTGLVTETEGLKLNPGKKGEITLVLHPPQSTLAGDYIRTIKLASQNRPDLVLLDALYLKILPDDRLDGDGMEITPLRRTLPQDKGEFEISITNQGNIQRDLTVGIRDEQNLFAYTFKSNQLLLLPTQKETLAFTAKPRWFMFWRRPFWGKGLEVKFAPELQNTEDLVLPETRRPPALPTDVPQGTIVWSRRPLWHLILLITLLVTGVSGTIFFLWWQFFRLPPAPRIKAFGTTKVIDETTETESVVFNWEIDNLEQLQKISITSTDDNNKKEHKSYRNLNECDGNELQKCIPQEIVNFCNIENRILNCQKITTNIEESGKYTFELQLFPKPVRKLFARRNSNQPTDSDLSDTIAIADPAKVQAVSDSGLITSRSTDADGQNELIELRWEIDRFSKLKRINVLAKENGGKTEVYPYSISEITGNPVPMPGSGQRSDLLACSPIEHRLDAKNCLWSIERSSLPNGDYKFDIELFADNNSDKPSDTLTSKNTITIAPQSSESAPKIEEVNITERSYEEEKDPVLLNWTIANANEIQSIIVKAISSDGSSRELTTYRNTNAIRQFCSSATRTRNSLTCRNVPVGTLPAGNYSFELVVIPQQQRENLKIAQKTDTITIQPQPFEITSFTINGKEVKQGSTYLYPRQKGAPVILDVAWSVKGGNNLTIQLLPFDGKQKPKDSLRYSIPAESNREKLTLKVTDRLGQQQTRSILVQPYISNSPATSTDNIPGSSPSFEDPTRPEPIEIAPQPN